MLDTLFAAVGIVLILEGLMPLLSPRRWRELFRQVMMLTDGQLRFFGLVAVASGLLLLVLLN